MLKDFFFGEDWFVEKNNELIIYKDEFGRLEFNLLGLNGDYQIFNAGLCIAALRLLKQKNKITISDENIINGLKKNT